MRNKDDVDNVNNEFNEEEITMLANKAVDSLVGLVLSFILLFLAPYVFMLMWKWFIVRLGVPNIGYWHAFGLTLLVNFLTYKTTDTKVTNKQLAYALWYVLITWLVSFGISFLV